MWRNLISKIWFTDWLVWNVKESPLKSFIKVLIKVSIERNSKFGWLGVDGFIIWSEQLEWLVCLKLILWKFDSDSWLGFCGFIVCRFEQEWLFWLKRILRHFGLHWLIQLIDSCCEVRKSQEKLILLIIAKEILLWLMFVSFMSFACLFCLLFACL